MERNTPSSSFNIGASLPQFSLKNIDDRLVTDKSLQGAAAALVFFTCNHCPYVKGSEAALADAIKSYLNLGLRVIAINSNDAVQYPDDSFENMVIKAREHKLPYPYLYDETQEVAKAFDAACTPEFYLFNAELKLVYHGTVNDSPRDASKVTKHYLADALKQLFSGKDPEPAFTHPVGCSIKWKN